MSERLRLCVGWMRVWLSGQWLSALRCNRRSSWTTETILSPDERHKTVALRLTSATKGIYMFVSGPRTIRVDALRKREVSMGLHVPHCVLWTLRSTVSGRYRSLFDHLLRTPISLALLPGPTKASSTREVTVSKPVSQMGKCITPATS